MKVFKKVIKVYLLVAGIAFNVFILWIIIDLPFYFDKLLIKSEKPIPGEAIVCLAGGITGNNIPIERGWQRIYTAVQLYFDGYAPKIIFSGGGIGTISEAEVYAEAAQWLGCPEEAIAFDPKPTSTAEHPLNILKNEKLSINTSSPLNIVTSSLHSTRVSMCFKKRGFTNFRLITSYSSKKLYPAIDVSKKYSSIIDSSKKPLPVINRSLKKSRFKNFHASNKKYNDIFIRLKSKTSYFFEALREAAAIVWYKIKGYV